jgi:hypothetical protein
LTGFTTHPTTNSPQKHHTLHPLFPKTPAKTALRHAKKYVPEIHRDPLGEQG